MILSYLIGCGHAVRSEPQDSAAVLTEYRNEPKADVIRLWVSALNWEKAYRKMVVVNNGLKEKVEMLEGQLSEEKARRETAETLAADLDVEVNRQRRDLNAERDHYHELQKKADQYKEIIDKAFPGVSVKVKRVNY